jgi:hypothetical protein
LVSFTKSIKRTKNTEHIIKQGKMEDFILGYYPHDSICIDDYKFMDNKNKLVKVIETKIRDTEDAAQQVMT